MRPDTCTLVALTCLAGFFVVIVFAWVTAFRHSGADRMVSISTPEPETDAADDPVRIVEVPIAGAVDGGPALGGRVSAQRMRIANRDTGQRRTVRHMIAPATPIFPVSIPSIPDERRQQTSISSRHRRCHQRASLGLVCSTTAMAIAWWSLGCRLKCCHTTTGTDRTPPGVRPDVKQTRGRQTSCAIKRQ